MKKIFLLCYFLFLFSIITEGQTLYLNENFNYGTAANADITVASTNWVRYSGTAGPSYVVPGLTYTGYPSSGVGGASGMTFGSVSGSVLTGSDGDARIALNSVISTTTTIYFSFLANITAAKTTSDYFIHLSQSNTTSTIYRARPFVIANGAGYSINFSKSTETALVGNTVLQFGKTYLFVVKYVLSTATGDDDTATLYIYESGIPASEPGSPLVNLGPIGAAVSNDPTDIGFIALRQGSNGMTGTIDGISAANSWTTLFTVTEIKEGESEMPASFELSQNYPNPFNPSTTINYQIPQQSFVNISVYDILGNHIGTLKNEEQAAGRFGVKFETSNLPSGVYFYRIQAGNFNQTKKMIVIK